MKGFIMPEVRIKTDFGEIVIPFTNLSDLEEGLKDLPNVIETVNAKVEKIIDKPKVKAGFEDIYRINDNGSVSILKPGGKTENIGIVLFAYDPIPQKVESISLSSGVKKAQDFMKGKYFARLQYGYYKLNADGLFWVVNEVVPKLRVSKTDVN